MRTVKTSMVKHMKRCFADIEAELSPIYYNGYIATTKEDWVTVVKDARSKAQFND